MRLLWSTGTVLLLAVLVGCDGTRQIQTAPPQPATGPINAIHPADRHAALTVTVETGLTALPEEVQSLRFRVATIHLKPADSTWTALPADLNSFEISRPRRQRKVVLRTQIPAGAYDSLAISLSDVFVQYDANSGGPLTMPRNTPLRLDFPFAAAQNAPAFLRLAFEPGAALSHDADCRWYFLPFFTVLTEATAGR